MANPKKTSWTDKFFIAEYLKHGSVNKVFSHHNYNLPTSVASYHRLINDWGGVGLAKTAGPNSNISEILLILSRLLDRKLPLETFFRKYVPVSLKPALSTTHRVLRKVREGVIRRLGTALIITPNNNHDKILVGHDMSLTNNLFGHKGDISFPMGYSKHKESSYTAIKRVLEREVFTNKVIDQSFPYNKLPKKLNPFMTINIADVSVNVYHLKLSSNQLNSDQLSSFKLKNLRLIRIDKISKLQPLEKGIRPGVVEIAQHYQKYLTRFQNSNPSQIINSQLNQRLAYIFS